MAFNPPNPDPGATRNAARPTDSGGGLKGYVQAEKMMQIAFVLPCALLFGWGCGWWIDNHFHQHWAAITGVILGIIAGMVSVIRMALDAGKGTK